MKHLALVLFFIGLLTGLASIAVQLLQYEKEKKQAVFAVLFITVLITLKVILDNGMFYIWLNVLSGNNSPQVLFWYYAGSFIMSYILVFFIPVYLNTALGIQFKNMLDKIIFGIAVFTFSAMAIPYALLFFFPETRISGEMIFYSVIILLGFYIFILLIISYQFIRNQKKRIDMVLIFSAFIIYGGSDLGIIKKMIYFDAYPESLKYHLFFYLIWCGFYLITGIRDISYKPALSLIYTVPEGFAAAYRLTAREMEIIEKMVPGKSNHEIAESLFISMRTVKNHLYNIYQKLGVKNRVELLHLMSSFKK